IRRVRRQGAELQRQAFAQAARADAHRLEVLQVFQHDLQFVEVDLQLRGQERGELLQALREIAIVVQRIDQQGAQLVVPAGQVGEGGRIRGRDGLLARVVVALEQGIFLEDALELLVELEGGELQQADRLLQLRREREVLGQP